MTEEKIREILPHLCYTKEEVDLLLDDAVAKARAIDELSMKKHNRNATIISMILGFLCLALFGWTIQKTSGNSLILMKKNLMNSFKGKA